MANPQPAVDGGDGLAVLTIPEAQKVDYEVMAQRTQSDPSVNPTTGAELGATSPTGIAQDKDATDPNLPPA